MAIQKHRLEYRLGLIDKAEKKELDFRNLTLLLQQIAFYESPLSETNEWNYNNATAYLTKEQLLSETDTKKLQKQLFINFFRDTKIETHLMTLKFQDWVKCRQFISDFDIKPQQILLASWIYVYKSVFLTFVTDQAISNQWFDICENSLRLFNCYGISIYGQIFSKKCVLIPSHVSDRFLNSETLTITDDLEQIINHSRNAFNNPLNLQNFQDKIREKYEDAQRIYDLTLEKTQTFFAETDEKLVNDLVYLCKDPLSRYSNKEERSEWSTGIRGVLGIIQRKIATAKCNQQTSITLTLSELYCYCRKYSFTSLLNVRGLRNMINRALVSKNVIKHWNELTDEIDLTSKTELLF